MLLDLGRRARRGWAGHRVGVFGLVGGLLGAAALSVGLPPVTEASPVLLTAPTWTMGAGGAAVAGMPFAVHVRGNAAGTAPVGDPDADVDPAVGMALLPVGVGCAASYAEVMGAVDQGTWRWLSGAPASEPFDVSRTVTVDTPGTYPLCGYFGLEGALDIEADAGSVTGVYAPASVTVARPTVSAALHIDGVARPGAQVTLAGTLASNAPETVEVYLNRGDHPCAANGPAGGALDQFGSGVTPLSVFGSQVVSQSVALPDQLGVFRLCVYASRDGFEGDPDLVKDAGTVKVERPVVTADLTVAGVLRPGQPAILTGSVSSDWPVGMDVFLSDGGAACRATGPAQAPFDQFGESVSIEVAGGPLSVAQLVTLPARTGAFRLCAYAARDGAEADPDLVADLGLVTVGRPTVSATASLQGFLMPGSYVRVLGTASSDMPATLTVLLNHRDDACAASSTADLAYDRFPSDPDRVDIDGGKERAFALNAQLPDRAGTYHLCLYMAREGVDADPDLVADSAGWPGGLYLVEPQNQGIGEVVYADGTHGTVRVTCRIANRRPKHGQAIRLSCPHTTGTIRFSYRRIEPHYGQAYSRTLTLSSNGNASTSTRKLAPGLYRMRVQWKGWVICQNTIRIHQAR